VHERLGLGRGFHRGADLVRDLDAAELGVSAGDGFGEGENIGLHAPVFEREPLPRPTEASDDLVRDEEDSVFVADGADEREVVRGRDDDSADAHDRFRDERRDGVRAFVEDRLLEGARGGLPD